MGKGKEGKVQFQVDRDSKKIIGKMTDGEANEEINSKIAESLKRLFKSGLTNWVSDYDSLVDKDKHIEAFNLLDENKGTIPFSQQKILDNLIRLDSAKLNKEQRKLFILIIIAVASQEVKFGQIENYIDSFIDEFWETADHDLKENLNLSKANAAAQNNKINVARNFYSKVIDDNSTSSVNRAYAYRGLSKIAASEEESIEYNILSADKFLEAGRKNEAIKDLVYTAQLHEKNNPQKSLDIIDTAIYLYDGEDALDREFCAGLHHRKAGFLHSLGKNVEALESMEKACKLRDGLIGNDYEKYSSHSVAKMLCKILSKTKRAVYHTRKIKEYAPKITSQEFRLQIAIQKCMETKKDINGNLLSEIEQSDFKIFKFSAYTLNAISSTFSFEEKLEWLDKTKLLLNKRDFFNHHYAIFYFTAAEVYRVEGLVAEAVVNYKLSLQCNPFYREAIQNCGAVLWKSNLWEESKDFFQKQLKIFGETPTLCYALGRSFFELKNYQEAFTYFQKITIELDGVNIEEYIRQCLVNDRNLKMQPIDSDSEKSSLIPITIESFKTTIERFALSVSSNSRMYFWENDAGKHKWTSKPEEKGKQLLITALEMRYGKDGIDIIQERNAGAGKIDLYLLLRGGLKIVVELKMCGIGYSSGYTVSGEDQLIHYLKNIETSIGYLIVFDGRSRDFGKGLKHIQSIGNITLFTTSIEMNPKVDKPSLKNKKSI